MKIFVEGDRVKIRGYALSQKCYDKKLGTFREYNNYGVGVTIDGESLNTVQCFSESQLIRLKMKKRLWVDKDILHSNGGSVNAWLDKPAMHERYTEFVEVRKKKDHEGI